MPECHRHRRSIRLRGYDYRQMGAYYVTLCTYRKYPGFGEIVDGAMFPNLTGSIAESIWNNLPSHFSFLELDAFVLMPNHLHGILVIADDRPLSPSPKSPNGTVSGSLGAIIQNLKSVSIRFHPPHQSRHRESGNHLAAQLLRTYHSQRSRLRKHPKIHHRKPPNTGTKTQKTLFAPKTQTTLCRGEAFGRKNYKLPECFAQLRPTSPNPHRLKTINQCSGSIALNVGDKIVW
jgi:REP element-mobilizing transposase RayT